MSSIRALTKQTLIYGVGTILTRFVTFLLLPLYTNVLTTADYGLVALVFAFLGFMNHVYNYGLDSAVMRFYGEDTLKKPTVLSTAIWMTISTSLLFSLLIYLSGIPLGRLLLHSGDYGIFIQYTAGILFFDCICRVPFALLRLEEKPLQFMGVRLINVVITLVLNIYFVAVLKMGVLGVFRSTLITSAATAAILYLVTVSKVRIRFSGAIAKDLLLFGLPFIPSGLATATMEMLNRYIIERLIGLEAAGIFSAGFKLGVFMLLVTTAFYYAWQPFFIKAGKQDSSRQLFARVLTYFVLVALSIWVLLTLFIHEIIYFHAGSFSLIGANFRSCEPIVPLILLGYVFQGINLVFLPGIYFEKKTRYLAYMTFLAASVNVLFNFLLIPPLGILGSAIASLLGYMVLAGAAYLVSQKLFPVPYEFRRVILLFVVALGAGVPGYLLHIGPGYKVIIVLLLPVILRLLGFFKKAELQSLKVFLPFKRS
jgi:O-antigen/teichoic acid export membrane protein